MDKTASMQYLTFSPEITAENSKPTEVDKSGSTEIIRKKE